MKSAFELAMERLGGPVKHYTDEQKQQLAEIDKVFEAKIAQAKFAAADRKQKAEGDLEKLKQIQDDMVVELASLEEKREAEKERLRRQFDGQ